MYKKVRILIDCLVIVVAFLFLIFGIKDAIAMFKGDGEPSDNVKFARTYRSVDKDNIYRYVNEKEALELTNEKSLIILGKKTDPWMQVLVNPLETITKDYVKEIHYLELDDIDTSSKDYRNLEERIGSISSPKIVLSTDGEILTVLDKTDIVDLNFDGAPIEYFDEERIDALEKKLDEISNLR